MELRPVYDFHIHTKYLGCANVEVVKTDVSAKVAKFLKVKETEAGGPKAFAASSKGLVGSLCQAAVGVALPALIDMGSGKLPESWDCSGAPLKPLLDKLASEACSKIKV